MLQKFLYILISDIQDTFNLTDFSEKHHIIDLSSSTSAKFSHHIIINHCNLIFADNYHAGRYAKYICQKLKDLPEMKVVLDDKSMQVNANPRVSSYGTFVDEGVYTKNRNFRLYLSSKFKKKVCLQLTKDMYNLNDKNIFLNSLVTHFAEQIQITGKNRKVQPKLIAFEYEEKLPRVYNIESNASISAVNTTSNHNNR